MKDRYIGVFDSGIGGVTVLSEIIKLLPYENYIYYSDSLNNPYGNIDDDKLFEITCNIMDYFVSKNCKAVVIACNTASSKCSFKLREKYKDIIIVCIEPAYKMVHDYAYTNNCLVMATPGTINSEKFKNLYNKYDNGKTTILPCKYLANMIEEDNENLDNYLNEILSPYKNKVSSVVLGCTHYPLIKDKIKNILNNEMFFDGSIGCAKQLKKLLGEKDLINNINKVTKIKFIDSTNSNIKKERFIKYITKLSNGNIDFQ